MWQYLANNEKLVDPEKRQFFDNDNNYKNDNNEYNDSTTDHYRRMIIHIIIMA